MASDRRFALGLAWRLLLLFGLAVLSAVSFQVPGLLVARFLLLLATAGAVWSLWFFINRTNRAIARFLEALHYDDFAQRFSLGDGSGFPQLAMALDNAVRALDARRRQADDEVRFLSAVVDYCPVPLLMIDDGSRVTLLNKAARRQFRHATGVRLADFEPYGAEFQSALALTASGRRITRMLDDAVPQRTVVESARIERLGQDRRIVSILPVQGVLGAAEMAAQNEVVRVLTHEIMNSLTPVMSLARSAADLLAANRDDAASLTEARLAIDTAARRAEGLHRFVESYRSFANVPDVRRRLFPAEPWLGEIVRLFKADARWQSVRVEALADPALQVDGDPELLAQLCLNLLRNAAMAAMGHTSDPLVQIAIMAGSEGRARIDVADNGPGIPANRREDVFLPFYTTRADGHGVGLSFVRQIVTAHGGAIAVSEAPIGGALFRATIGGSQPW